MGDNFAGRSNRLPLFGELRGDADLGFSEKRALGTTVNDKICRLGTFNRIFAVLSVKRSTC